MPRTVRGLIRAIERQIDLMIDVATGGSRIQEVNTSYIAAHARIQRSLQAMGIQDPNPYADLWEWYNKWSSGDLPTWQSRRIYIREMYSPLLGMLHSGGPSVQALGAPTGWARVDRCMDKVRRKLAEARDEEDFQGVGLLCREAIISVAQVVYDPERHRTLDGKSPSPTDAKRQIEAYIATKLAGPSNEALRKQARASLDLANALQHKRTAGFRLAALAAEATTAIINVLAIVSGRRDPSPEDS